MDPRERDVEAAFRRIGRSKGALVLKFTSPGTSGVPDRVVLHKDGRVDFVELKAPGERPRRLQVETFRKFEARGHPVSVVDTVRGAEEWWEVNG